MALHVLVVDDNPFDRELAARGLRDLSAPPGPARLSFAGDWSAAAPHLGSHDVDLVLLDYHLPGLSGLDVLHELAGTPHPPIVMITGQGDLPTAVATLRAGAADYVPKAAGWERALCLTIERVCARVRVERELADAHARLAAHAEELQRQVTARTAVVRAQASEIEDLYLRAEEAARLKAEIVANVSHELRTPLSAILGYSEILADELRDAAGPSAMLAKVRAQGEQLRQLVESLLAVARLQAGNEGVTASRFPVTDLIAELQAAATTLKVSPHVHVEWDVPVPHGEVVTDREKVRAIAYHLLSNALKFTSAGHVAVTAHPTPDAGLVLAVVDTGIGLPPDACAIALEDFRQLDGSSTRHYEGLGLGLGIVRRYTTLLGGDLKIDGAPGAGTRVTVTLPPARSA